MARSRRGTATAATNPGGAREVLLGQREGQAVVDPLRGPHIAPRRRSAQGQQLLRDGLVARFRWRAKGVARGLAPGVAAVAAGEDDRRRAPAHRAPPGRDEAVTLEEALAEAPVADGIVLRRIGAGQVHDRPASPPGRTAAAPHEGRGTAPYAHPRAEPIAVDATASVFAQSSIGSRRCWTVMTSAKIRAGPVAVVQVEVHDGRGSTKPFAPSRRIGDRHVVEARNRARRRRRVVETPAEVDHDPPRFRLREPVRLDRTTLPASCRSASPSASCGARSTQHPVGRLRLSDACRSRSGMDPQEVLEGDGARAAKRRPGAPGSRRRPGPPRAQQVHRHAVTPRWSRAVVDDRNAPRRRRWSERRAIRAGAAEGTDAHHAVVRRATMGLRTTAWTRRPDDAGRTTRPKQRGPNDAGRTTPPNDPPTRTSNWPTIRGRWPAPLRPPAPGRLADTDDLLGRFLDYVAGKGLTLYPAQEEAILELFEGKNVILNTPTGSGKSLVASALHFASLAHGRRSVYTCPIKALVNEKWMALCRELGPGERRPLHRRRHRQPRRAGALLHGRDARQHRPARGRGRGGRRRGDGRVPLVRRPRPRRRLAGAAAHAAAGTRFLLMSATLGDVTFFAEDLTAPQRPAHRRS